VGALAFAPARRQLSGQETKPSTPDAKAPTGSNPGAGSPSAPSTPKSLGELQAHDHDHDHDHGLGHDHSLPTSKPSATTLKKPRRFVLQPPPADFSPPILTVDQPEYDWKSVLQGEVVVHTFQLKNTGGSNLQVESVRPSCGCTTVNFDKVVEPGKTGNISLSVDTKNFSGPVRKYAEVSTNASRNREKLTISGNVEPVVSIEPKLPRLDVIKGIAAEPLTITVQKASSHPIKVAAVDTKSDIVATTLEEVEPGSLYRVKVTPQLKEKDLERKFNFAELAVKLSVKDKTFDMPVRVSVTVKDRLEASPTAVFFSRADTNKQLLEGAQPLSKPVTIKTLDPNHQFRVTSVEKDGNVFETALETVAEGKEYRLQVTLPPLKDSTPRRVVEKITLKTDDPQTKEFLINCTASIGSQYVPQPGGNVAKPQPGQLPFTQGGAAKPMVTTRSQPVTVSPSIPPATTPGTATVRSAAQAGPAPAGGATPAGTPTKSGGTEPGKSSP
jgi:hypothetical protein